MIGGICQIVKGSLSSVSLFEIKKRKEKRSKGKMKEELEATADFLYTVPIFHFQTSNF